MESTSPPKEIIINPDIHYPWYQVLKNPEKIPNLNKDTNYEEYLKRYYQFEQGDFIFNCSVLKPKNFEGDEVEAESLEYDLIILSQSCDLIHGKLDLILVSPVWHFPDIEASNAWYKQKEAKEALRRGHQPNYHLLNKCEVEPFRSECYVVDFRHVFGIPFDQALTNIKNSVSRLRLLSPYKEHLSQAFARFFMRVGLPIDIEPFASKAKINYELQ